MSDADEVLDALAAELADLNQRVDDLAGVVSELVTGLAADSGGAIGAPWIPGLDADARREHMRVLTQWLLEELVPRQPELVGALCTCWSQHPDVVDNLTALRSAWKAAYSSKASPTAAMEWLDRWAPAACKRIDSSLRRCRGRVHVEPPSGFGPAD